MIVWEDGRKLVKIEYMTGRRFIGEKLWNGASLFHGIVYARYARFGMPEMVEYGEGEIVDAREYGCVCPQNLSHLLEQLGPDSGLEMREGELCLSVTVPEEVAADVVSGGEVKEICGFGGESGASGEESLPEEEHRRRPVMVWIHGGFYLTGGSEDHRYDVSSLAQAGDVIVVKISYRLGAEGYIWHPERGVGNLGLEDQKTALRWIRRHIASFGGDPDNVTVFGQSAGAHSIASLIASSDDVEPITNVPRFGGEVLFHRAILQSPPLGNTISQKAAAKVTDAFLDRLASIAGLESGPGETDRERREKCFNKAVEGDEVTLEHIIEAQDEVKSMRLGLIFLPVLRDYMRIPPVGEQSVCSDCNCGQTNGDTASGADERPGRDAQTSVPGQPNRDTTDGKDRFRVIVGYNADDASPYIRKWTGFLWKTPLRRPLIKFLTDKVFRKPALRYAAKLRSAGIEARIYCFSWHPQGSELGACHSIELPFLLGKPEDWVSAEMLRGMTREEYEANSAKFRSLWTKFARSGDFPATGSLK